MALKRVGGVRAARSTEQELRNFLGGFGFRGARIFEPIAPFSGGEKARLVLALIAYLKPNLMLLDEPTNHLDLEMREALTLALQEYEGAVVLVSHDRHLLRTVANEFRIVHAGRAEPFDGDLEDYAKWLNEHDIDDTPATAAAPSSAMSAEQRKQRKRDEAAARNRLTPLRAAVAKWERELDRLTRERAAVHAELSTSDIYSDGKQERLRELLDMQSRLAKETEIAEAAWLESNERLEAESPASL